MHHVLASLLILLALLGVNGEKNNYIAAVVEHAPIMRHGSVDRAQAIDIMQKNLDIYEQHIAKAKDSNAQIIVFPEGIDVSNHLNTLDGLYGPAFDTRDSIFPYLEQIPTVNASKPINPCLELSSVDLPILHRASCLARQYSIVLVLDMGDVQPCTNKTSDCPSDGRFQFNTQVAFDEQGIVCFI